MARCDRFIRLAYRASRKADVNCTFSVGATITLGSRVISSGACTTKTHPRNPKLLAHTKRSQLCAEVVALLKASQRLSNLQLHGCDIYVARSRKDGTLAIAKPCRHCQSLLQKAGIRNIFYTNRSGNIEQLRTANELG